MSSKGQSVDQTLTKARSLAKKGELDQAVQLYKAVLEKFPGNKPATEELKSLTRLMPIQEQIDLDTGPTPDEVDDLIALYRKKQLQAALERGTILAKRHPNVPLFPNILGAVNAGLGRLDQAVESYTRALQIKPDYAEAHSNLGNALKALGRHEGAVASYTKALQIKPDYAEAHSNLGIALKALGRHEEAVASFTKALRIKPEDARSYYNLGNALNALGEVEEAIASYSKALQLKPDYAEAHNNLGNALDVLGKVEEAIASYSKALQIKPDYAEAHNNLGNALNALGKVEEAIASYSKVLQLKPDYAEAHNNLGNALSDLGKHEQAIASLTKALQLNPDIAEAHHNLGNALKALGKVEEAIASYSKALQLRPDHAEVHWNQSFCFLIVGRFEQGWEQYEWRRKSKKAIAARSYTQPHWSGKEDITGKTLFTYWEQGLGDTIQFCRYAKLVEARGANVVMSVQNPLRRLLTQISPTIQILGGNEMPPNFDYHSPLMSLPRAFRTTSENIPAEIPYLRAEQERINIWKQRLGDGGFKIGICWQGRKAKIDVGRSYALKELFNIATIPNVRLISLQKNDGTEQLTNLPEKMKVETLGAEFDLGPHAFLDTAAVMANLDLIITSDTSIAHLAGALGRPTWVALQHVPDWRWLLEGSNSSWYPTLRLFRQQIRGEWKSVFEQMQQELTVRSATCYPTTGPF